MLASLVHAGVVDAAAACNGEVAVHEASRSNPVAVVFVDGEVRHVVKQRGPDLETGSSLDAETAVYRWLAGEPTLAGLAPRAAVLPNRGDEPWLVLDGVADAHPAHELVARLDGELGLVVGELAQLLKRLHTDSAATGRAQRALPATPPWVLELGSDRTPPFVAANVFAGNAVSDLLADAETMALVQTAREAWRPGAAIHGDVKWDNVLVRRDRSGLRLWLIDWELAAWGDPLWDLAAVVEGLLTSSVLMSGTSATESVSPLTRAAVADYGVPPADHERLVAFVGARLVQVSVQIAGMTGELGDSTSTRAELLELATSLAGDPGAGKRELLGAEDGC